MNVEIDDRLSACRDVCPHADIRADVEECKSLGVTCYVFVTVSCEHESVCRYRSDERGE